MAEDNELHLYNEGDDLYAAMLSAIAGARGSILMETYIFADDEIGRQFAEALIEANRRGVDVRLHVDAAGSLFWHSRRMERQLRDAGIKLRWFHRWSWRQPWRYNRRNHRKILVIDRRLVFLGGFNIHRENSRIVYGEERWHDLHISVSGHYGEQAAQLFDAFWEGKRRVWAPPLQNGDMLISNHGHAGRRAMRRIYHQGFAGAEQTIDLITPYFVPDHVIRRALMRAAKRGVRVRLLLPRKTDVMIARWAAHASYARLLEAGVQIYEYLPRVLHAKLVIIDGRWAAIGTANIDYRSFFVNYELNMITADQTLCNELQKEFERDILQSERVYAGRWARRHWLHRLAESSAWLVRRWL